MKFDMTNIHTIFEAKEEVPDKNLTNDETGANLDNTLGDNDLLSIFDDICPICGDVYASMKNAAADPKNLKITMVKSGEGEDAKLFIEAVEFMTFCEARGCNEGEASEEIISTYKEEIPEMDNAEFHVVFPSDALNKNVLGSENYGRDVKNDWAMQLMRGCRRYGLKVNSGVEGCCESDRSLDNSNLYHNNGTNGSNVAKRYEDKLSKKSDEELKKNYSSLHKTSIIAKNERNDKSSYGLSTNSPILTSDRKEASRYGAELKKRGIDPKDIK